MDEREAIYLQSIREACPNLRVETVRSHNRDGQFNDILIINEEFVFRFPKYLPGVKAIIIEIAILDRIRAHLALSVPNPIYRSTDTQTVGRVFMGYRMIPGEPLWKEALTAIDDGKTLQRLATQLASFLQQLHSIPVEITGADLPIYDNLNDWVDLYADFRRYLFPYMRPDARNWVTSHFETFLNTPRLHTYKQSLRHGDFGPSNILYAPKAQAVSGIIDFGFVGLGDPAVDIAAVSCYGEPFLERFYSTYPVTESMVERARFYKGTYALQEALHGIKNGDKEAFENGIAEYV